MKKAFIGILFCVAGFSYGNETADAAAKSGGTTATHRKELAGRADQNSMRFKAEYLKNMQLPGKMKVTLAAFNPDFVIWTLTDYPTARTAHYPYSSSSLPYAVKGDFNGDGISDMALAGHDNSGNKVLLLLSSTTGEYSVLPLPQRNEETNYRKLAKEHGKTVRFTATTLLVLKPKGTPVFTSDMADSAKPLPHDAVKTKEVKAFVVDTQSQSYLSFEDRKDGAGSLWFWTDSLKYAMGGCDEMGPPASTDPDYCF